MLCVTCAIIENEKGKVLLTQRSAAMSQPLKWEFPGGKVEDGEDAEACLIREIREELDIDIIIVRALPPHLYDYPEFTIQLIPFIARQDGGNFCLHEHRAYAWVEKNKLLTYDLAPADVGVVDHLLDLDRS